MLIIILCKQSIYLFLNLLTKLTEIKELTARLSKVTKKWKRNEAESRGGEREEEEVVKKENLNKRKRRKKR